MRCKLCPKQTKAPRGRYWKRWQICLDCFQDIKGSDIAIFRRTKRLADNCVYCLRTLPQNPNGGKAFCNESHRQQYYKRESIKRKNRSVWLALVETSKTDKPLEVVIT